MVVGLGMRASQIVFKVINEFKLGFAVNYRRKMPWSCFVPESKSRSSASQSA